MRLVIVQPDDDNRARVWKKLLGIGALLGISRHVGHFAVETTREPLLQPEAFVAEHFRADDADLVESDFPRARFYFSGTSSPLRRSRV